MTKNREFFFGSELSEANNESTFRIHQKMTKNREKNREKIFLAQNCLNRIMSQISDYTKKLTKIEKKNRKIIQNFLKRKMSQLLDYTKKLTKNREKKIKKLFLGQNYLKRIMS